VYACRSWVWYVLERRREEARVAKEYKQERKYEESEEKDATRSEGTKENCVNEEGKRDESRERGKNGMYEEVEMYKGRVYGERRRDGMKVRGRLFVVRGRSLSWVVLEKGKHGVLRDRGEGKVFRMWRGWWEFEWCGDG